MQKRRASEVIFVTIFAMSMTVTIVLSLEIFAAIIGQGGVFAFPWGRFARLSGSLYSAIVVLIVSGFLPIYLVVYYIYLRNMSRASRTWYSILIFVITFILLWLMISDWSINSEIWLLFPGILSVAISDFFAEKASGCGKHGARGPQKRIKGE